MTDHCARTWPSPRCACFCVRVAVVRGDVTGAQQQMRRQSQPIRQDEISRIQMRVNHLRGRFIALLACAARNVPARPQQHGIRNGCITQHIPKTHRIPGTCGLLPPAWQAAPGSRLLAGLGCFLGCLLLWQQHATVDGQTATTDTQSGPANTC